MRSSGGMTINEISRICTVTYAKSLRACAISQGRLMESFLETQDLTLLLEGDDVAFTDDDANALKAAVDDLKQKVDDLKKLNDSALGGKMKGSVGQVEALMGDIPDVSKIASLATAGEGEKLKEALEELNEPINKVGESIAIMTQAFQDVAQNIAAASKGISDEQKKMTVGELSDKAKNKELKTEDGKDIDFPDPDSIKKGASKALVTPGWFQKSLKSGMDAAKSDSGGFFKKAVAFMKGLFGGGGDDKLIDPETFATEFMELTLEELEAGAKASADLAGSMKEVVASNAEATGAAQASAAAEAEGDDGGDGELPDSAKKAEKRPDFNMADLIKLLAITNAGAAKSLEGLPEEEQEAAVADDLEAIQGGEVSPEEALDGVAEEAEEAADAPKWSDITKDFLSDLSDESKPDGEELTGNLKDNEDWAKKVGASINMAEGFVPSNLPMAILLREDIAFDDIMTAASSVVDDEAKAQKSAIALAQSIIDAGVEVADVPSEEEGPEAKDVEAALDELEPGLTSYIDDNQDIIAKALADLLKGQEEIAAKVAALLAADEGERSGEAEDVAAAADDAGISQDEIDAAIEKGIEDASGDLNDEITQDMGSSREEVQEKLVSVQEAEDEELKAKVDELISTVAGDLGADVEEFKASLEDDDKFAEFYMGLEDKSIDDVKGAIDGLKDEVTTAMDEAGISEDEESGPGEMTPEEQEEAEAASQETGEAWAEAQEADEAQKEEAEEEVAAAADELGIDPQELTDILEDPEPGDALADLVKAQELEIEKLQAKIEELDNTINDILSREISDEPGNLSDDEKEQLEKQLDGISDDVFDVIDNDEEAAMDAIEGPAGELGVDPEEFSIALAGVDEFDELVTDNELTFTDSTEQIDAAVDAIEGAGGMDEDELEAVTADAESAGESWEEILGGDDEGAQEEAEEAIAAAADEIGVEAEELTSALEDPDANLDDLIKDNDLSDKIEDMQKQIDDLSGKLEQIAGGEEEGEEGDLGAIEAEIEPVAPFIEDIVDEDGDEEAIELVSGPADDAGISPDDLLDIITGEKPLEDAESDLEDFDAAAVKDAVDAVEASLDEEESEDDPAEVDKLVKAATDGAEDPEESEDAVEKAITTAIDDWEGQLSDRQKKRIAAKNRLGDLKQGVADATPPQVDAPVDPDDVKKVGDDWASTHKIDDPKSPLGNPKNFSPKQMQKLIDLFPQIATDVQGEEGDDKGEKNTYKRGDFEKKLEDAFTSAMPDLAKSGGDMLAVALGDWIMNNDVEEVVLESKDFSKILLEKYDFKAISDFMKGEISDLAKELGYEGKEEAVLADFLRAVEPVLGEEGIEIDGIPDDSTEKDEGEGKPQSDDEEKETDAETEKASAAAEKEAESKGLGPSAGAEAIVAKWAESGKTLSKNVSKKQREKLKGALGPILDTAADKLKGEVEKAVDDWRGAQKVLQKPNVSDKQIATLKQSLSDFISTVVRSEARDPMQAKRALVSKIQKFLLNEAGYLRSEIQNMNQHDMLTNFVHSYCNIQMHALDRKGMLVEVLETRTNFKTTHIQESVADRWTRLAGL